MIANPPIRYRPSQSPSRKVIPSTTSSRGFHPYSKQSRFKKSRSKQASGKENPHFVVHQRSSLPKIPPRETVTSHRPIIEQTELGYQYRDTCSRHFKFIQLNASRRRRPQDPHRYNPPTSPISQPPHPRPRSDIRSLTLSSKYRMHARVPKPHCSTGPCSPKKQQQRRSSPRCNDSNRRSKYGSLR